MKRRPIRPRRDVPRRRSAPRWNAEEWAAANVILTRRSSGRCECCGRELAGRVERHHRQRRTVGGDRIANLMYLLPECHHHWTTHPAEAMERGIIVPALGIQDPALVPVLYRAQGWVLLDDNGGRQRTHIPTRTG